MSEKSNTRLSVDVPPALREELKIYTSLTVGETIQSVVTKQVVELLKEAAGDESTRYSRVANRALLGI